MICLHHWLVSTEENGFRCVAGCRGFLSAAFLSTLEDGLSLDGAYNLLLENNPERSEGDNSEGDTTSDSLKICSVCRKTLPRNDFHKRRASADGLQSRCKVCNVAAVRASRRVNSSKIDADSLKDPSARGRTP